MKSFILRDVRMVETIAAYIRGLDSNKRWRVLIEEAKPQRSDNQNRALWAAAYPPIMDHMGLRGEKDREELHEYFCGEYWGWNSHEIFGRKKLRPKRTTTTGPDGKKSIISTIEFMDFYAFIQQRGADNGVDVPDPDPLYFMKDEKAA